MVYYNVPLPAGLLWLHVVITCPPLPHVHSEMPTSVNSPHSDMTGYQVMTVEKHISHSLSTSYWVMSVGSRAAGAALLFWPLTPFDYECTGGLHQQGTTRTLLRCTGSVELLCLSSETRGRSFLGLCRRTRSHPFFSACTWSYIASQSTRYSIHFRCLIFRLPHPSVYIILYFSDISYTEIQDDINCLFHWSQENLLLFNADKCKCMLISNKRHVSYTSLALDNQPLQYVQHYKYLGVTVSHNLSWTQHIHEICKKARRVLGMIYNKISKNTNDSLITLKLYTALVRPHLEYAAQVWNPYLQKDIQCLVQQFALRICAKSYTATYEDLLNCFLVPSLRNRRLFLLLCSFYCIINELLYFPQLNIVHPHFSSSRSYNPRAFYVPYARCNNLKCSFVCTAIHLWNSLPLEAQVADNLIEFKHFVSSLLL